MPGYDGNPDAGAEAALEHVDNLIHASQEMLKGRVLSHCADCGEEIDPDRVALAVKDGRKCEYCIDCQVYHDKAPKVKMLTHIL